MENGENRNEEEAQAPKSGWEKLKSAIFRPVKAIVKSYDDEQEEAIRVFKEEERATENAWTPEEYERAKEEVPTVKKIARKALYAMGIMREKIDEERDLEAYVEGEKRRRYEERGNKFFGEGDSARHSENADIRAAHEKAIKAARVEKKKLNDQMIKEMVDADAAIAKYKTNREMFKLDFENRATGVDDFEDWVIMGEDGISKESVEYEGEMIPVYHLTGHNFCFLVHDIGYRSEEGERMKPAHGESIARSLRQLDDPGAFVTRAKKHNQVSRYGDFGKEYSVNISTSLLTDKMPDGHAQRGENYNRERHLFYGFSDIGRRKIIAADAKDAAIRQSYTGNIDSSSPTPTIFNIPELEQAALANQKDEGVSFHGNYNEIAIDRYEEDSDKPLSPQFIFVPAERGINELVLRHAKYYGIPIVVVDEKAYIKKNIAESDETPQAA
ncbi:hypothetical protein IKH79_02020 [Candidatus Saccharibacteria bacterium]|nr:hypothetical protein [Candidatus Saccharibacteria bacterium]